MHWRIVGIHKNEWCYKYHWKTNKNRYGVYNLAYTILNRCFVASTSEENIDNWWLPPLLGRSLKRMEIWRQLKVLWSCWCISLVSSCRKGCSSCIGKPLMCPGFLMAVVVIHSLSHVRLGETPRTAACQASLSFTISHSLLKFISTESVMPSKHLILCCPLLLLPSIFPNIRVSYNELALHIRWPKYWGFTFCIGPFNEYSGLISFRTDCWQPLTEHSKTLLFLRDLPCDFGWGSSERTTSQASWAFLNCPAL